MSAQRRGSEWLEHWDPEDAAAWENGGKQLAWRTMSITTGNLTMAFATWFFVSAIAVKLDSAGISLSTKQLFWLTAMPGLAGGTLRIIHTFLVPIVGTRKVVAISTALLLIPLLGWTFALQHPGAPYWLLIVLAFAVGLGGGNFSSFMPSTSLFFPKRLQGSALGLQAGIGNFGVSLVQFVTPWVIGFAVIGSAQHNADGKQVWLQNAAMIWIPFVLVLALIAWFGLKSVPVRANVREQADIFKEKHTWIMTSLYIMTFGSFAGFSTIFPLLIKKTYGGFEGAPVPLHYAFVGPLVGSAARVLAGPISDRFGGARVTTVSGIGLLGSAIGTCFFLKPSSVSDFDGFLFFMLALFFFAGIGNASTFKQIPMIFAARQAGGVLGWTAAIAAYGPFLFAALIGTVIASAGSAIPFFIGAAVFYALNIPLNWWFYARRNAECPC
ncbi:MAG: nitrate/nitrite transporter [Actinomycetes bacterium]